MQYIKTAVLLYFISLAIMYFLSSRRRQPIAIPGDLLILKAGRTIYIPLASSLLISVVLYLIIASLR